MDQVFQNAFRPPRPVILGRQLHPLSLGHLVLLESGGCIFTDPAPMRPANAGDLAAAVWVCSQKATDLRMADNAPQDKEMIRWGLQMRKRDLRVERCAFIDYLTTSLRFPKAWETDNNKKPVSAWQFAVASALIESGVAHGDVWDMPVSEALALYAAVQERKGLELMTPEEQKAVDAINQKAKPA